MLHKREDYTKLNIPSILFILLITIYGILLATYPSWFQGIEGRVWRNDGLDLSSRSYFAVTDQDTPFADILSSTAFKPYKEASFTFAGEDEAIWLRIPGDALEKDYAIYSVLTYIRNYDIYFPFREQGGLHYRNSQFLTSGQVRGRSIHAFAHLPDDVDFSSPIYIKVTGPALNPQFSTMVYEDFSIFQNRLSMFYTIHFTIFMMIFIVNLLLFFMVKARMYLYHALYLFSGTMTLFYYSSIGNMILDMKGSFYFLEFQQTALFFVILFLYDYLRIGTQKNWLKYSFSILLVLSFLSTLYGWIPTTSFVFFISSFTSSLAYTFIFFIAIYAYKAMDRIPIWIPLATFLFMVSAFLSNATFFGVITYNLSIDLIAYTAVLTEAVVFTLSIFYHLRIQHKENANLKEQVMVDHLTGLKNRYYLDQFVKTKLDALDREGKTASMIILDIDHFKKVNDEYGHDVGDRVLATVSTILSGAFRKSDVVARLGGEEFIVLLYDTPLDTAKILAERARHLIAIEEFDIDVPVTISLGVAEKEPEESFNALYKRADDALYQAKSLGRNQVRLATIGVAKKEGS